MHPNRRLCRLEWLHHQSRSWREKQKLKSNEVWKCSMKIWANLNSQAENSDVKRTFTWWSLMSALYATIPLKILFLQICCVYSHLMLPHHEFSLKFSRINRFHEEDIPAFEKCADSFCELLSRRQLTRDKTNPLVGLRMSSGKLWMYL